MNIAIEHLFSMLHSLRDGRHEHSDYRSCSIDGFIEGLLWGGLISTDQYMALGALATNAYCNVGKPFPSMANAGPIMPSFVFFEREKQHPKSQAAHANEKPEPVSAPATPRELRLLCLLVETATESYTVPLGTMHPVPPRASIKGRWPSVGSPGVVLRQTHAQRPTAQVLARLQRHGQAHAIRATARTFQFGVTA